MDFWLFHSPSSNVIFLLDVLVHGISIFISSMPGTKGIDWQHVLPLGCRDAFLHLYELSTELVNIC
jgi:hypothetical protein